MVIHISRAGAKLGSFSVLEVRRGLASGRFFLTDLGWKEGMEHWAPLSEFSEFEPEPPSIPPLPEHEPVLTHDEEPDGLPWERRDENGLFLGFFETVWMILISPVAGFSRMRLTGSMFNPLVYNLIGGWIGWIVYAVYFWLYIRYDPQSVAAANAAMHGVFKFTPELAMMLVKFFIIMGPVIATAGAVFCAAIIHLLLMLSGGANKAFHVTLRVFCYSCGSAQLLQLIPSCGNLIAPLWMMIACVVGLGIAHKISPMRAVAPMALFLVLSLMCCAGVYFLDLYMLGIAQGHP